MTPQSDPRPPQPLKRVGYVGLAGAPNVGKSTLVNALVGEKVSIVSPRPQTTREEVRGIYTDDRMQAIFADLPGILSPRDFFDRVLMDNVRAGLGGCDLVWHLCDARSLGEPPDPSITGMIRDSGKQAWRVWNKIDLVRDWRNPPPTPGLPYRNEFSVSAATGQGVQALRDALVDALPLGPELFDPDQFSDRDLRYLVAERVREQLFIHLGDELPYATASQTEAFEEKPDGKTFIRVVIFTEREAHKPIIIGHGGTMLKRIGEEARREIERLLGEPVFLELWVKVRPKWRKDEHQLRELGIKSGDSY